MDEGVPGSARAKQPAPQQPMRHLVLGVCLKDAAEGVVVVQPVGERIGGVAAPRCGPSRDAAAGSSSSSSQLARR